MDLEKEFESYCGKELARYDSACGILAMNLKEIAQDLQGGYHKGAAIEKLDGLLKEAKEAKEALGVKKAEFKALHGLD